ncbi:MAG: c-type cytochrome [Stellaceae bacterium]
MRRTSMRPSPAFFAAAAFLALAPGQAVAEDGAQLFHRDCSVCHSTEPAQNKIGPSLAGVVGRKSGSEPGYDYSDAMLSAHLTWDAATLDKYLADPRAVVPGNKMLFVGVKNPADRQAIIQYLGHPKS